MKACLATNRGQQRFLLSRTVAFCSFGPCHIFARLGQSRERGQGTVSCVLYITGLAALSSDVFCRLMARVLFFLGKSARIQDCSVKLSVSRMLHPVTQDSAIFGPLVSEEQRDEFTLTTTPSPRRAMMRHSVPRHTT